MMNILYSYAEVRERGHEQFIEEHSLGYIMEGEVHFFTNDGVRIFHKGTIGIIRRNQFARSLKVPVDGRFQAINILLTQDALKEHPQNSTKYVGESIVELTGNERIKAYFDSLLPYFHKPEMLSPQLASLKTQEAIQLLLRHQPALANMLFDFSMPHKIDLEAFMQKNFQYHVPLIQFARMTGRSLATFKRDFEKTFNTSPEKWLLEKRLEHAHFLLKHQHVSPGDACYESGFENLSHFSASFKTRFGYTPSSLGR